MALFSIPPSTIVVVGQVLMLRFMSWNCLTLLRTPPLTHTPTPHPCAHTHVHAHSHPPTHTRRVKYEPGLFPHPTAKHEPGLFPPPSAPI